MDVPGKLTRREIALALSGSAAALAQTPAPSTQTPVLSSDDELKAARDSIRQNSEALAKFPLPLSTEPAARFKA